MHRVVFLGFAHLVLHLEKCGEIGMVGVIEPHMVRNGKISHRIAFPQWATLMADVLGSSQESLHGAGNPEGNQEAMASSKQSAATFS